DRLVDRKLISLADSQIELHDLQHDFLLLRVGDTSLLHADLLDAYRELLPAGEDSWSTLPEDEPYIWDRLIWHLRGAGARSMLATTATDLGFIALRCYLAGPHAAEADLATAALALPDDGVIGWLAGFLSQRGYLLRGCERSQDAAATLRFWLIDHPAE